jgi:hypothetical protein
MMAEQREITRGAQIIKRGSGQDKMMDAQGSPESRFREKAYELQKDPEKM